MLNIDDRLLSDLDESEMYLVLHIAKFMTANRMTAWPSLETLSKNCNWDERTVKKHRQSLVLKGYLEMKMQPGKPTMYRFLKDGIGVYRPMKTDEMIAENEGTYFEGGTKNEGTQNVFKGVQKMRGEVVNNIEVIKRERGEKEKTALPPSENPSLEAEKETPPQVAPAPPAAPTRLTIHDPETPGAKIIDIIPGEPKTQPPTPRIELGDRAMAETPTQLETALRDFYKEWPNEWSIGVLENGRGSRYGQEKRTQIVKDFCCWAVENNRQRDTFRQLNASLQKWFRNEEHATWKQKAAPGQAGQKAVYTQPDLPIYTTR
jgi:hypothetical protein